MIKIREVKIVEEVKRSDILLVAMFLEEVRKGGREGRWVISGPKKMHFRFFVF